MKYLMLIAGFLVPPLLLLIPATAFSFVPPVKPVEIYMTTDTIYLKDRYGDTWETITNCKYGITEKSNVSIVPLNNRYIRVDGRLAVKIDDQKQQICRIVELSQKS